MRRPILIGTLVIVVAGLVGYFLGSRAERTTLQLAVADAQASKILTSIRRDMQLLTDMREKKYMDLVKDTEQWTILQLRQIEPDGFIKGSASDRLYPETLELVNAYRKRFPDTLINPEKDPSISKAFRRVP